MQKMVQNACVQISNMKENIQNVGHWRQACMNVVMKGPGSLSAAIPSCSCGYGYGYGYGGCCCCCRCCRCPGCFGCFGWFGCLLLLWLCWLL